MKRANSSVEVVEVAVVTGVGGATGMVAMVRRTLAGGMGYVEEGLKTDGWGADGSGECLGPLR